MGGMKKKPVGSAEKSTSSPAGETKPAKKEEAKKSGGTKQMQKQKLSVLVEEPQGIKVLQGMKAITAHGFARNSGVKISVANAFIKSMEAKGMVRSAGGYSGHRIYEYIKK